jgi:putative transposase
MSDDRNRHAEEVTFFRYGLIAELVNAQTVEDAQTKQTMQQQLEQKAAGSYCIPRSRRTRLAVETLRDWIKLYQKGGLRDHLSRCKSHHSLSLCRWNAF